MKPILITLLLSSTFAAAAPQISPQRIIVNPVQTSIKVDVRLDRAADNSGYATYHPGEKVQIKATVNEDAYLYLFSIDAKGEIVRIFPNQYQDDNFVQGGQTITLPAEGDPYTFEVDKDLGVNKVFAVASRDPLDFDDLLDIQKNAVFAVYSQQGQDAFAKEVSGVLSSIDDDAWSSDVVLYRTTAVAQEQAGDLLVKSNVKGAKVYLNGEFVGESGTSIVNLAPGKYQVKVVAAGYTTYSGSLTLTANRDVTLTVNLPKAVSTKANLFVRLNVNNAKIYMNGQLMGSTTNGKYTLALTKNKQYKVSIVASGYTNFASYVKLNNDKTLYVNLKRR